MCKSLTNYFPRNNDFLVTYFGKTQILKSIVDCFIICVGSGRVDKVCEPLKQNAKRFGRDTVLLRQCPKIADKLSNGCNIDSHNL